MRSYAAVVVLGALALLAVLTALGPGRPRSSPVTVQGSERASPLRAALADLDPEEIVTVISRDAIDAIREPRHVPAADAEESGVGDDDLVIGVELGAEARAYPIKVLSAHEIVNDSIAGRPIAVTW